MKKQILYFVLFLSILPAFSQVLDNKDLENYNGFFDFHYDEGQDKIYLEVKNLDQEFLYVNSLATGVGSNDIGLDRGLLGRERIVKFQKAGNKLLLIQPNQNYRAITDNVLEKKSIEQAFAKSVLYGFKIEEEKNGTYIIDITPFLMEDVNGVASTFKRSKEGNYKLDASKSALSLNRTKAFPKNVEFEALLTFKGQPTGKNIRTVAPTASLVSVIQHHSFIELPDNEYKMREFDVRSGAISISYLDYATPIQEQIRKRYIIRHRLEKKNPNAELSEAKEPIIYYLDPGTPEPVRSALLDGARWWNQAYESIGFKDAFQVKMLPADADPMDCRYNVIQWVHRSTRGWSYGGSVIDPRTGEIIKGHVSLGSLRIRQDFMIAQALLDKPFAERDDNYQPMLDMALARIRQLSAHEIGHTIGFAHNFAASPNQRSSVMDYPHPLVKLTNGHIDLSDAYAVGIGDWDKVTVAYSYSEFDKNSNETEDLNKILKAATLAGHRFISDRDARAKGGAHASAHLWDNGKSASEELDNLLAVREKAISNFSIDNIRKGEPLSVLEDVFVPLYFFHRFQTEAAAKVIGGLDYNYAVKGDGQTVVKSVDAKMQRDALNSILKTLSAEALAIPKDKLELFPPRAFEYYRSRESFSSQAGVAFDPMSAAATASDMTLSLLLHPERANRLVYQHSLDSSQLNLDELLKIVIENSFKKQYNDPYLNEIQQIINTNVLKHIMNLAVNDKAYFQVNAIANQYIDKIKSVPNTINMPVSKTPNSLPMLLPNYYSKQYKKLIEQFNEDPEEFILKNSPKIPDGSPIGSDKCNYNTN
ncbi:zinc-dependent metalloprotease [Psychroserpens ponticola]|uniref:Zinc-dependent metalloprotease n=1 Tax=Psychroserpens ponticola TaxID=2932268 RepID=A0ABY7S2U1_9FLAO|nr:zinc-dependent metalloprotease [Psychroserpens ponticola]WCO03305.1 zinc-dependent metalloprotease [Psychroserpens ponticola]